MAYIHESTRQAPGHLGWFIDTNIGSRTTSAGHETLTDRSAKGILTNPAEISTLIDGSRRPDLADPKDHIKLGEQRRHFLKSDRKHSSQFAWSESIRHLQALHRQILTSTVRADQLALIGEAMHLIQDSFAPAHAVRDAQSREIVSIRFYGPGPLFLPIKPAPDAHSYLIDPDDSIFIPSTGGKFKPEAQEAIDAGKDYLQLALRHISLPQPRPQLQISREVQDFVTRWLWFKWPFLRPGSRGLAVSVLKKRLNIWLGQNPKTGLSPLPASDIFGRQTSRAVKAFQKAKGLRVDGVVGKDVWERLGK